MTRWMRLLHKWLGLIVGVQVLIWLVSGLAMNWLDPTLVAGENVRAYEHDVQTLTPASTLVGADHVLATVSARVATLELKRQHGYWVWRAHTDNGAVLFDARTGSALTVDATLARAAAEASYFGEGVVSDVTRLDTSSLEARDHSAPMWRVAFNDEFNTRYYISADDGRILERRNDAWRWFDFFWMLHTMDYVGRDNFNTPWVIFFGFGALWLALSGAWLVVYGLRRHG